MVDTGEQFQSLITLVSFLKESSVVDLSEDDQIQAAIQASLDQEHNSNKSITINSDSECDSDELETFSDSDDDSQPSPHKTEKKSKNLQKTNADDKPSCSKHSGNTASVHSVNSKSRTLESESRTLESESRSSASEERLSNGHLDERSESAKSGGSEGYRKFVGSDDGRSI